MALNYITLCNLTHAYKKGRSYFIYVATIISEQHKTTHFQSIKIIFNPIFTVSGARSESHQSGIEPDYTRTGGEYVNFKKRKFFSRFFEIKHNIFHLFSLTFRSCNLSNLNPRIIPPPIASHPAE